MQVREILQIKGAVLYTIAPEKRLAEAVQVMTDHDVGSLVCFSAGQMVGMLTFREVLLTIQGHGALWQDVPIDSRVQRAAPQRKGSCDYIILKGVSTSANRAEQLRREERMTNVEFPKGTSEVKVTRQFEDQVSGSSVDCLTQPGNQVNR